MRSAIVGLFVIIMVTGMVAPVAACAGGPPAKEYFNEKMNAGPGEYTAKSFTVKEFDDRVYFDREGSGDVYMLTDDEMARYEEGQNISPVAQAGNRGLDLDKGTYWVVLDNTEGNETVSSDIEIHRPAVKGCGDEDPFPFIPGFQMELAAMALIISAVIGISMRRRG